MKQFITCEYCDQYDNSSKCDCEDKNIEMYERNFDEKVIKMFLSGDKGTLYVKTEHKIYSIINAWKWKKGFFIVRR